MTNTRTLLIAMSRYVVLAGIITCIINNAAAQKRMELDLTKIRPGTILHFDNSIITSLKPHSANEDYIEIDSPVSFRNTVFTDTADFSNLHFKSKVDFTGTVFNGPAFFDNDIFCDSVKFNAAYFKSRSSFNNAQYYLFTDYTKAVFDSSNSFVSALFRDAVNFSEVTFKDSADFSLAIFTLVARFNYLHLSERSKFNFYFAHFLRSSDWSLNPVIPNEINLTATDFDDSSAYIRNFRSYAVDSILLYQTDISKLHLDYLHFSLMHVDRIGFPNVARDSPVGRKWIAISADEYANMYEGLLKNFTGRGQTESARLLDVEYRQFKWEKSWWVSHFSFLSGLPSWWWNFGYNKELIFLHAFYFLLIFTGTSFFILKYLNEKVYCLQNVPRLPPLTHIFRWQGRFNKKGIFSQLLSNLAWRLWYSFVYTATIFFSLTLKIEEIKFQKIAGTLYLVLMYTTGIICLAYMANFILQK